MTDSLEKLFGPEWEEILEKALEQSCKEQVKLLEKAERINGKEEKTKDN